MSSHIAGILPPSFAGESRSLHRPAQGNFAHVLDEVSNGASKKIKFSSHALTRMNLRNISLSRVDEKRLEEGVASLASRGSKDGLVVLGENRFVVSVENKTVITAMTSGDRDVFTNIDAVVFN